MPPNDPGASGSENVQAWFEATFSAFSIGEMEFPERELSIDGQLRSCITPTTGPSCRIYVYEKQGDGSWLVSHDIWTSSEPLPGSD